MSAAADPTDRTNCEVLIIGGGPAGLTAAAHLAPRTAGRVLVVEREAAAGGIPRHSDHVGYGIRDLRRFISGPAYARRLVAGARHAGADILTDTMVTGWADGDTVEVTSPAGRRRIRGAAIILATGARERPRPARLVPGDRPGGVLTTGQLQNLVHLHGQSPGERAVIVGAELVSYSAVLTLRHAGCRVALMTSLHDQPETFTALALGGRLGLGLTVATRTRIARIIGHGRVQAVETEHLDTGARRTVACDTVVFTGDWIPDHELARAAGIELDPHTRGPLVDTRQATRRPGLFAIGNLTHPVDTADVAALDGRAVVPHVLAYLARGDTAAPDAGRLIPGAGLRWISPGLLHPGVDPPRNRFLAWPERLVRFPTVTVTQGAVALASRRLPWTASPGRVLRIPAGLVQEGQPSGEPIRVSVAGLG